MAKRKTFIELQSKPENKSVRQFFDRPKTVDYAPLSASSANKKNEYATNEKTENIAENDLNIGSVQGSSAANIFGISGKAAAEISPENETEKAVNDLPKAVSVSRDDRSGSVRQKSFSDKENASHTQTDRMRIFQTSTPVTRTVTKFQKAAIVVRGANGKELVELFWRDQMNEKTRDIWNFLVGRFVEAKKQNFNELSIRKKEILEKSGVKSDRTFISAVYTLEDMGLIEVRRLSGNKEGNIYILTDEGREEIEAYEK